MRVSPFVYAAEVEQAAAATTVIEQADTTPPGQATPSSQEALQAVVDRFGASGYDLPFEYQNDRGVGDGRTPLYLVFH